MMLLNNQLEISMSIDTIVSRRMVSFTNQSFVSQVEASEIDRLNPQAKVGGGAKICFNATEEMAKALAGPGVNKKLRITIEIVDVEE